MNATVEMPASEYDRNESERARLKYANEDQAEKLAALRADNEMLRKALAKSIQHCEQLAGTANAIAEAHGLGRKVYAEDYTEQARAALTK